ncbi:PAS domain-containing protein [candidate division KSB1 bacterium]|nr:PAS domain-containing protein [candidate division KSB1 bacterium]
MFKKFKWNFVIVFITMSIIGFFIFDLIFYYSIKKYMYDETFREMETKTRLAVALLDQRDLASLPPNSPELYDLTYHLRQILNTRVTIIDTAGNVLTDSDVARDKVVLMDNHSDRNEIIRARQNKWGQSYRKSDTLDRNIFYTAFLLTSQGNATGYLRLAYYAQHFEESLTTVKILMFAANLVGLLLLSIIAYFSGSWLVYPISRIVRKTQEISSGKFDMTFPVNRTDEIGELSRNLNHLTGKLKSQVNEINDERLKLQHIINNLHIGVLVVDQDHHIIHSNPEIARILGMDPEEFENRTILEIIRDNHFLKTIERTLQVKAEERGKLEYFNGGDRIFLSFTVTPFTLIGNDRWGALVQLQDIGEMKKLEAIRRDFVANASHELKTPLTIIVGYTETIMENAKTIPATLMKFIRKIREQAQRIEFLIADLLQISQLENDIPLEFITIDLIPLVREIVEEFTEQSDQKSIRLRIESEIQHVKVKANPELLRIVLNNLIDNAIKYTSQGGEVSVIVHPSGNDSVRVAVADNGIGIDPKYHDRIFQRFYRIDKARSRTLGGTGLGLSIVKHILERHGSQIRIESELSNGSRFWFDLNRS